MLVVQFLFIPHLAQETDVNSKNPLHKNPRRQLKLKEVLRIQGEGESYFFSFPNKFQVFSNGNFLFSDQWTSNQRPQLMMFSHNGKFLNNFLRAGEGPGEIQSMFDFGISNSEVFIYDYAKRKIVVMDMNGEFVEEWSNKRERYEEIVGVYGEGIVIQKTLGPTERKESRLYEEKDVISLVARNGHSSNDIYTFTKKKFYISLSQRGGMMHWDPFICTLENEKVFVCHSREYMIEVLNLDSRKIVHRFSREYERVKHQKGDWEDEFIKKFNAPRIKFDQDIKALFSNEGLLWVWTSTTDDEKGALFDIFSQEGIFLDSFYINIVDFGLLCIDGDFIYIAERDEDYLPYIVKYKIDEEISYRN